MSRVKDGSFVTIQSWMVKYLELKGNELIVYAIVYGLSQADETWFVGSAQYVADWINGTKRSAFNILKSLTDKGYIIKRERYTNGVKACEYKAVVPKCVCTKNFTSDENSSSGVAKEFHGDDEKVSSVGGEKSSPNNIEKEKKEDILSHNIVSKRKRSESITDDKATELMEDTNISEPLKEKVHEWLQYKSEIGDKYKTTGFKTLLKQVEQAEQKHGATAVMNQIDVAMASTWHGMFLEKIQSKSAYGNNKGKNNGPSLDLSLERFENFRSFGS